MSASLEQLLDTFEHGLRGFIVENAKDIRFTHPQYAIEKLTDDSYDLTVSVSGMGVQTFELSVIAGEFIIKGKLVDTTPKFPYKLVADLVNGVVTKCLAESVNPAKLSSSLDLPVVEPMPVAAPRGPAPKS